MHLVLERKSLEIQNGYQFCIGGKSWRAYVRQSLDGDVSFEFTIQLFNHSSLSQPTPPRIWQALQVKKQQLLEPR